MVTLQIVKETSTILKLQGKEYDRQLIIPGLILLLTGLVIMNTGEARILKCHRLESTEVACEFTYSRLLRKDVTPLTSEELQGAETEVSKNDEDTYYRLIVSTRNKKVPITDWNSGRVPSTVVDFKAFLNDPERKSLNWWYDSRYFSYFFGGIFALFGGCFLRTAIKPQSEILCLFNKRSGQLCLKVHKLDSKSQTRKQMLQEIKEAKFLQKTHKDGDKIYQTNLILISGEEITLQSSDVPSSHYEITQSINRFLGVSDKV